jgi:hypothetical protein
VGSWAGPKLGSFFSSVHFMPSETLTVTIITILDAQTKKPIRLVLNSEQCERVVAFWSRDTRFLLVRERDRCQRETVEKRIIWRERALVFAPTSRQRIFLIVRLEK